MLICLMILKVVECVARCIQKIDVDTKIKTHNLPMNMSARLAFSELFLPKHIYLFYFILSYRFNFGSLLAEECRKLGSVLKRIQLELEHTFGRWD